MPGSRRYFTAPRLDRAAELRADASELRRRFEREDTRLLPVFEGRVGMRRDGDVAALAWLGRDEAPEDAFEQCVFLGFAKGSARFALRLSESERDRFASTGTDFVSLRRVAAVLDGEDAGFGAYALAMDHWLVAHRFCGACGAATAVDQGGFRLLCSGCRKQHFPRLDPAIIVSVRHGRACLLGRQASWPERRYSVLAGFVEPGEALEDAVAREVLEESGVRVGQSSYRGSQPWPFPSSLMIGFSAEATDPSLAPGDELDDVRWFDPEDLLADLAASRVVLPPPLSISRHLIDEWLAETTGQEDAAREFAEAWR